MQVCMRLLSFIRKYNFMVRGFCRAVKFATKSSGHRPELFIPSLFRSLFHCNCNCYGSADHGVVAHADEAHHLDVRRDGGGASELRVAVHSAHGIREAIGGRASGHVIRVQGSACAATGSNGEIFLAVLYRPLLIRPGDGMLEAGGVGGVAGDGDVYFLGSHDGNAFEHVVGAVALDGSAIALGECFFPREL